MASFDAAIPPGKAGTVTAQVKTESYRGPVEKSITVTSSDPEKPSVALRVKVNVIGSVEIYPRAFLTFPTASWEYAQKVLVRKDKTETGELKISDTTTTSPWLSVRARRVENPEPAGEDFPAAETGDWILDVAVSDEAPGGQSGQQIRFKTGLPREPDVSIPASVVLQQAMHVVPENLVLRLAPDSNEATATFSVMVRPGLGKDPVQTKISPGPFSIKMEPAGEHRYKGTVLWMGAGENTQKEGSALLTAAGQSVNMTLRVVQKRAAVAAPQPPAGPGPPAVPADPAGAAQPPSAGSP